MSDEVTKTCSNRGCALVGVNVKVKENREDCVSCGRKLKLAGTDALLEEMSKGDSFGWPNPFRGKR